MPVSSDLLLRVLDGVILTQLHDGIQLNASKPVRLRHHLADHLLLLLAVEGLPVGKILLMRGYDLLPELLSGMLEGEHLGVRRIPVEPGGELLHLIGDHKYKVIRPPVGVVRFAR